MPSRTDLEILSVLWEQGTITGREIQEALIHKGVIRDDVAYTTIRTYLDRLVQKGYAEAREAEDRRGYLCL